MEPKILLVTPPILRGGYGVYAEAGGKNEPIGILSLAAVLEKNNINVQILDAEGESLTIPDTIKRIAEIKPNILGITSSTTAFNKAKLIASEVKNKFPEIKTIIGGPHVTALPEETLEYDFFDFGIVGEAEYAFLEFINALKDDKNYTEIKSLVYKDENKKVHINPRRELIKNLDELPMPAIHLLKDYSLYTPQLTAYRKKPVGTVITSRGCPYQCIFCDRNAFGNKFRARSPEKIIEEIEYRIKKQGVKEIAFLDDTFTINKERVIKICDLLIEKKIDLIWSCSLRADTVDKELLKKMKQAGCWLISLGVESGNEQVLKFIKKNLNKDKVRECCKIAKEVGLKTRGFFMIGHPIDTKETIRETIDFAKSLPLYIAEFSITTPFPNTELDRIAENYGKVNHSDTTKFSQQFPVFVPNGLTKEYLDGIHKNARKEFYLRPKKILELISDIKSPSDIKKYLIGFKILIKSLAHHS